MLKVRAFDQNKEFLIPIDTILSRETRGREIHEITLDLRTNRIVQLSEHPISLSELVIMNGLVLTEGASYDYILSNDTITFNIGVLAKQGHILIKYKYLN